MVFVEFNIEAEPFTDVVVRRAINHAVNKMDVLGAALEEYGEPGYGFLSPSLFGYWDGIEEYSPVYDVEQAKTLLAEAGWEDADGDVLRGQRDSEEEGDQGSHVRAVYSK